MILKTPLTADAQLSGTHVSVRESDGAQVGFCLPDKAAALVERVNAYHTMKSVYDAALKWYVSWENRDGTPPTQQKVAQATYAVNSTDDVLFAAVAAALKENA